MVQEISKDEMIGYHKGAINTLLAERNELLKIAHLTENLIKAHAVELEKLGVKISQDSSADNSSSQNPSQP